MVLAQVSVLGRKVFETPAERQLTARDLAVVAGIDGVDFGGGGGYGTAVAVDERGGTAVVWFWLAVGVEAGCERTVCGAVVVVVIATVEVVSSGGSSGGGGGGRGSDGDEAEDGDDFAGSWGETHFGEGCFGFFQGNSGLEDICIWKMSINIIATRAGEFTSAMRRKW